MQGSLAARRANFDAANEIQDNSHYQNCWGGQSDEIRTGGCLCFRTCGASEAIVKAGCMMKEVDLVDGGAVCVWPCCQMVQMLDLSLMTLSVESPNLANAGTNSDICVYTKDGVPVRVNSVAQVRIGPPPEIGGVEHAKDDWEDLSKEERAWAIELGFTRKIWNTPFLGVFWDELGEEKQVGALRLCHR